MIHFDVMDGHFVKNITMGPNVLKSLSNKVKTIYDVHLMIKSPMTYIDSFIDAGADIITIHLEIDEDINEIIQKIKNRNKKVGISIKPKTNIEDIYKFLPLIDLVLIMSVEPGFGGQEFIENSINRIKQLRNYIKKNNLKTLIEVDGGINDTNINLVKSSGADIVVAGSFIFNLDNYKQGIDILKGNV